MAVNVAASALSGPYAQDVVVVVSGTPTVPFSVSAPYKLTVASGVKLTLNAAGVTVINNLTGGSTSSVSVVSRGSSQEQMTVRFTGSMSGYAGRLTLEDAPPSVTLSSPLPGKSTVLFETVAPLGTGSLKLGTNSGRLATNMEVVGGRVVPLSQIDVNGYVYIGSFVDLGTGYTVTMGPPMGSDPYAGTNPVQIKVESGFKLNISCNVTRYGPVQTAVDLYGNFEFSDVSGALINALNFTVKSGAILDVVGNPFGLSFTNVATVNVATGGQFTHDSDIGIPLTIAGSGPDGRGALLGIRAPESLSGPSYINDVTGLKLSGDATIGYSSNAYVYTFTSSIKCAGFALTLRPPPATSENPSIRPAMSLNSNATQCPSLTVNQLTGSGVGEVRFGSPNSYDPSRITTVQAGRVIGYGPQAFGVGTAATLDVKGSGQVMTVYDPNQADSLKYRYPDLILRSGSKMSIGGRLIG